MRARWGRAAPGVVGLVTLMAVMTAVPAGIAGAGGGPVGVATSPPPVERLAGPDRFATSAAVSAATFPPGVPVAYVTTGNDFADALAVGPIAGRQGAPVLTVPSDSIPFSVALELARLQPGRIVVVGGPAAVSDAVVHALGAYTSGVVIRIAGDDRYATAAALSASAFQPGVATVFLASGESFPDALAAGPAAARDAAPVLLTTSHHVPAVTESELLRLRPEQVIVVGGSSAISAPSLTGQLGSPATTTVVRVAGIDRYQTAVDLARFGPVSGNGPAFVVSGTQFADAEAAGPAAARAVAPILLSRVDCVPEATLVALQSPPPTQVVLVGGPTALGDAVGSLHACASGTPRMTVAPDTGLADGDTVKVAGTGFPTDQSLIVIQCTADPAIPPDGSGCDIADSQSVNATPGGTIGPVALTVRTGQLGNDARSNCPPTAAQAAAGVTCKVVVSTLDGAISASHTIAFRSTGSTPTLSAAPTNGLGDGDTVTLSGTGFPTGQVLTISECSGAATVGVNVPLPINKPGIGIFSPAGPTACDSRTTTPAATSASGRFGPVHVVVHTGRFGDGSAACPPTREQQMAGVTSCNLDVADPSGRIVTSVVLAFASTQTAPAQPTVHVSPATGLHDGDIVTVTATGFAAYSLVAVGECSPLPSNTAAFVYPTPCLGSAPTPWITTDQNGSIGPITIPVTVQTQDSYGPGPVPIVTSCPPTSAQQQAGIAACVISVAEVDGGMAAAAPIAFATGVTPPPPPPLQVPAPTTVQITAIVDPGDLTPNAGEHVVLHNTDPVNTVDVGNWSIEDLAGNRLFIGPGYSILAGGSLSVYTSSGSNTPTAYFNSITVSLLGQQVEELTLYTDAGDPVATFTQVTVPPRA